MTRGADATTICGALWTPGQARGDNCAGERHCSAAHTKCHPGLVPGSTRPIPMPQRKRSAQPHPVKFQMIFDEGLNEEIGMIIALLPAQDEALAGLLARFLEKLGL